MCCITCSEIYVFRGISRYEMVRFYSKYSQYWLLGPRARYVGYRLRIRSIIFDIPLLLTISCNDSFYENETRLDCLSDIDNVMRSRENHWQQYTIHIAWCFVDAGMQWANDKRGILLLCISRYSKHDNTLSRPTSEMLIIAGGHLWNYWLGLKVMYKWSTKTIRFINIGKRNL